MGGEGECGWGRKKVWDVEPWGWREGGPGGE